MKELSLPHDLDVERALLASIFLNPSVRPKIQRTIEVTALYLEAHQEIYSALIELKEGANDLNRLVHELRRRGVLEKIGGVDYLADVLSCTHTSAGVNSYCEILNELSKRRSLITLGHNLVDQSHNMTLGIDDLVSTAKREIRRLSHEEGRDLMTNTEVLRQVWGEMEARSAGKRPVGVLTGLRTIDHYTQGLEPKTSWYIIGRPSMGKTALALNIAERIAARREGTVLFFSLEMSAEAIMRRRLAAESGVFLSRIRAGDMADDQYVLLLDASNKLADRPFIIIDQQMYRCVEKLSAMAETLAMEQELAAIFVDHIQEMKSTKKTQNRNLELGEIARSIKYLGKDLGIPTVVLCQLSRASEGRTSPQPRLSDMRDSGELEQIADGVIGVYRASRETDILELGGLKGRDTGTWKVDLHFNRFTQRITE